MLTLLNNLWNDIIRYEQQQNRVQNVCEFCRRQSSGLEITRQTVISHSHQISDLFVTTFIAKSG